MPWDVSRDYRTGYTRAVFDDGRLHAVVQQSGLGYQWAVSRQRMQGTLHGSWWDRLGDGNKDTSQAARREAYNCLKQHRVTKTAALRMARTLIAKTKPARPWSPGWLVCAECHHRVVAFAKGGFAETDKVMLADRLAEHLVKQCDGPA